MSEFIHPFWDGVGIIFLIAIIAGFIVGNLGMIISHFEKKG